MFIYLCEFLYLLGRNPPVEHLIGGYRHLNLLSLAYMEALVNADNNMSLGLTDIPEITLVVFH